MFCQLKSKLGKVICPLVTIVESEKDNFRSEFYRNRNCKGFKNTSSKYSYPELGRMKALDNYPENPIQ
jgi:hypothetical protein